MRYFRCFIFFIGIFSLHAQNFEDKWTAHFSYVSIIDISEGDDLVYVGSENAVFSYNKNTSEIKTITTVNGLSGENISTIYYSENYDLLVIGYENGLMDVVRNDSDNVLRVVDILDKPTIPPNQKRINNFTEYEGDLYIATDYGISVYDLANLEFGDTYYIGFLGSRIKINEVAIQEPYIYAATQSQGIRRAEYGSSNLINYEEWSVMLGGGFQGILTVADELYAMQTNNTLLLRDNATDTFNNVQTYPEGVRGFKTEGQYLNITTPNRIYAYSQGFQLESSISNFPDFEDELQTGLALDSKFYVGTFENGLYEIPFQSNTGLQILPDGPIDNRPFAIDAVAGQLWVCFGDVSVTFNPFPLTQKGISNLTQEGWVNIPFEEIFDANDLVDVKINPNNSSEVYFTSYQKGLLKVVDKVPSILYNETNSPLEIPGNNPDLGIRLYGLDFDAQGNLWFNQSRSDEGLFKLSPSGQFSSVDVSSVLDGELSLTKIEISRQGFVFTGSANTGLTAYNPNTEQFVQFQMDEGNGNLPTNFIKSLSFDNNQRLWIGTFDGLRVIFNTGGIFEEGADNETQQIIILEDGVPQELLFQQTLNDIETDGSNNKWIATATSGVFYLSSDGQETLLRFTKDNSPLPSNNVQDIAIDPQTGEVYFATVNGLVSYNGSATAPRDNLDNVYAFPNPVRPGFNGNVTIDGLTADANVKITDISGNLVFETTSEGGSVLWDTTAFGKYKVASGVYLVMITTEDAAETKIAKIMVVR